MKHSQSNPYPSHSNSSQILPTNLLNSWLFYNSPNPISVVMWELSTGAWTVYQWPHIKQSINMEKKNLEERFVLSQLLSTFKISRDKSQIVPLQFRSLVPLIQCGYNQEVRGHQWYNQVKFRTLYLTELTLQHVALLFFCCFLCDCSLFFVGGGINENIPFNKDCLFSYAQYLEQLSILKLPTAKSGFLRKRAAQMYK